MVSEPSVLRPESMDEIEQQIMLEMSEKLEEQKQGTEALASQIEKLVQSQAKFIQSQAKLIQSQKNLETIMPRFFSQISIPPRPPSQPPDPPDFNELNLKFDGTLLSEWVIRCEQFFMKNNTPPEQKVRIVSFHMEGEAFNWHYDFIRNRYGIFPSWPDYIVALSARFGGLFDDPLSELMSLKQHDDPVETYLVKFERALSRLSLPVAHALNIFLTNMSFHLASHVRQFDVTTIADAVWIAKRCESSLLQHLSATQSRAPFSPYQNYNDQPYYERKFGECPEIEFDRESDEIKDEKLQDKQPEEDVKTLVISENEQFLECVGDEPSDDEKPGEVIVEEIVDKPVESSAVRDVKLTINDVDMDNQLVLLENKKLLNIEAGDKKEKNSILSGKIAVALARKKCMVSKVGWSTLDLECDQTQFNNKEEFVGLTGSSEMRPSWEFLLMNVGIFMNPQLLHDKRIIQALLVGIVGTKEKLYDRLSLANYVWKPGELLCVQDQWDWISEVHSGELQEWNDVVAGHFLFDMVEKGNYLDEVIEEVAKTFTLAMIDEHKDIKTACVFLEMSLNRERLIQLGAPPVFSDLLCAMNRIQVRLKMVLLLEFLWLILFSSKMFKSSYVPQNKNQTNQKLSSYWKLLLRLLYPLHNNEWRSFYMLMIKSAFKGKEKTVSFNIAVTSCSRFCFFSYSSWMGSHNRYDLSSCVLRQEKNYVMALFPIGEANTG